MHIDKTFDMIKWDKLMEILKEKVQIPKIPKKNAVIKVNGALTNWVGIDQVMRHGCCLSPTPFNLNIEDMFTNILWAEERVSVGGQRIKCVGFADDMMIKVLWMMIQKF